MNRTTRPMTPVLAGLALAAALLAGSAQAMIDGETGTTFALTVRQDFITLADGGAVPIWGYSLTGRARAQYPGPTLIVNQGQTITVTLRNQLPAAAGPVSVVFPGQQVTASGGVAGLITREAPADGGATTVTYTFTATHAGTYLYHSGSRPEVQVEMGLVGALIVRPAGFNHMSMTAYGDAGSSFDHEALFLLTEMDPRIHDLVAASGPDALAGTDLLTSYFPVYWFINGRTAPDTMGMAFDPMLPTQPYNCMPRIHPGERLLMRVVGGGRDLHPFHHHGNHATVIARDGRRLGAGGALSHDVFTVQSIPGGTADAIFTWTGKDLGWDIYGDAPHACTPDAGGYDTTTREWCADHGKPFPVALPDRLSLTYGGYYSGSPYLGVLAQLPPGQGGMNPNAGYVYMFHSHTEKEMVNFDLFPGGMMTMLIVEPPGVPIEM